MTIKAVLAATVVALVTSAAPASSQALGDIAKKEEARRKTVKTPGKLYTNESLRPEGEPPSAPATDAPPTPATPAPAASGAQPPAADAAKKDEAYWKDRLTQARTALDRSKTFAEALQSRINALTTDFAGRDDPAQRAQIGSDREKALAELDRVKKEIQDNTKANMMEMRGPSGLELIIRPGRVAAEIAVACGFLFFSLKIPRLSMRQPACVGNLRAWRFSSG